MQEASAPISVKARTVSQCKPAHARLHPQSVPIWKPSLLSREKKSSQNRLKVESVFNLFHFRVGSASKLMW